MDQVYHYQVIVCDAGGERVWGQYDTYHLMLALDQMAKQIRALIKLQISGKPVGEGWVRLACLEDDTKSIMAGIL